MKFKVGDRVRLTREAIYSPPEETDKDISHLIEWDTVVEINDRGIILSYKNYTTYNPDLFELVPEECEFEYGEEVEVSNNGTEWEERIFLAKIPWNPYDPYVCVDMCEEEDFALWKRFEWSSWEYIRKHKPQLTRKEIAEKFWIDKDFIFVDG